MSSTAIVRTKPSLFEKGHAKLGGRQKGSRNRFGGDLREAVVAAALFARVLPYFINVGMEVPEVVSETEMEAMLKELGLPVGLIEHMQTAPAPLDLDEDPDPYGMHADAAKDVTDATKGATDAAAE
jgi:hypothetical protein